jgi:YHS domain-containing protein
MRTVNFFLLILLPFGLMAQSEPTRLTHFNLKNKIGIQGYDPVSYFKGEPKEGDQKITLSHKGVIYYFASETNRESFRLTPDKFEPAYGGWCAFAMGESGEKVKIDPETFKIVDGRLYLFYNFWGNNTLEDWNNNQTKLKLAADKNWSAMCK